MCGDCGDAKEGKKEGDGDDNDGGGSRLVIRAME